MPNPLEEYEQEKLAAKEKRKADEVALWQKWKDNGQKPEHLVPLLKLYEPVFSQKMRQLKAPQVPASAFKSELQKLFIKQLQTYNPDKGAALNTHVEYGLRKAQRYNNRTQNLAYIPEGQAELIGPIQRAQSELSEQFGREPTTEEIADHIGEKPKRIDTVIKAIRRDIPMSHSGAEGEFDYSSSVDRAGRGFEEQQIAVAKNILPDIFPNKPHLVSVFNYTFGTNDHPQISKTKQLAKKMGTSESNISRWKTLVGNTLRKHLGLPDEGEE